MAERSALGGRDEEIEDELCKTLGAEKVIWIPGDVNETGTDGHIDGISAFIEPGRVLVEINSDKGHDSFLLNVPEFLKTISEFLNSTYNEINNEKRI